MSGVQTKLLRHPGLADSAVILERHFDDWIEATDPMQLVELLDPVSLGLLRTAFAEAGGCEGTVWIADERSYRLVACFNSGEDQDSLVGFQQPMGQGIISMVYAQQQPYCENAIQASDGHDDTLDRKIAKHTTAMIAVPFYFGFGLRGVISCVQLEETERVREGFSSGDVEILARTSNLLERLINELLFSSALGFRDGG
ncbi:MAG: GAF domain-containing protein [Verrucomicrobiales bacterium]|jgi:hypothetical protein|nr:GAF domain-containing protein [Verrucomicrobiales bacterium]HQZ26995.1 hypothetical protein [Verrucomicrobiales bacterium]